MIVYLMLKDGIVFGSGASPFQENVASMFQSEDEFLCVDMTIHQAAQLHGSAYVVGGEIRQLPAKPSAHHAWNLASESWIDPRTEQEIANDYSAAIEEARTSALSRALALRAGARLAYITDIPGQDAIYQAKLEEARAYLSAEDPQPADYPLIMSEVNVTAPTAEEVAQVFINLNELWKWAASIIDGAYFAAQGAIVAATSEAAMQAALDAFEGALNA